MGSREWLIECGIGETRAALIDDDEIIEARIEIEGAVPAGSIISARLADKGTNGRNSIAIAEDHTQYLLPKAATGVAEGARFAIEVTRETLPGAEAWKRPLARVSHETPAPVRSLAQRLGGREIVFPNVQNELAAAGWDDVIDQARTGLVSFIGGELRISLTPAMTLVDVDGYVAPEELAVLGATEAARMIRRLDIGGSIGIDLPTAGSKAARKGAAQALDAVLPQPFERTAVNGFGFIQIVRPRTRPSLIELAYERAAFEARALLRRTAFEPSGPKRLVSHPAVIGVLEAKPNWTKELARQVGGMIELRPDPSLAMSGGYAEEG